MNKLTLRDKEEYAKPFFAAYKKAKLKLIVNPNSQELIITIIDACLDDLSEDERFIIENDYLKQSKYHWYEEWFSKSTYFRYKNHALLELYEMLKTISNNDTI